MEINKKWKKALLLLVVVLAVVAAVLVLYRPLMQLLENPQQFGAWIYSLGWRGVLAFIALNILQILVAFIPGGPFEMAAGMAYGAVAGSILSTVSMAIGGVLVVLLVRRFGARFVCLFISREKLQSMTFLKNTEKLRSVLFVLYLIPGAPKDVMTYVVGMTDVPLGYLAFIFLVARYPSALLTAMSGTALGQARYGLFAAIMAIFLVLYLAGSRIYKKIRNQ